MVAGPALSGAIILSPSVASQNTIQPVADIVPLVVKRFSAGTANDQVQIQDENGVVLSRLDKAGYLGIGAIPAYPLDVEKGSSASLLQMGQIGLNAGYAASNADTVALALANHAQSTCLSHNTAGNIGLLAAVDGITSSGRNFGSQFIVQDGKVNTGFYAFAWSPNTPGAINIGAYASGNIGAGGAVGAAGYFRLNNSAPVIALTESAALFADNGSAAAAILIGRDNGTDVFTVADGGATTIAPLDAATITVTNVIVLDHESSGTPAAGYGTGLLLEGASSTTASREMGRIRSSYDVATDATRQSRVTISAWDTVERDNIIVGANGSAPTLAFYNATPQAKQTVSGSRGGNAALASLLTALANLGLLTDGSSV